MSTAPNAIPDPSSNSEPRPEPKPRNPQFIALSELAERRMTAKDFLTLLPATIISLVFNTAFVIGLIWFNSGPAQAQSVKKISAEEDTKIEAKDKEEKEFIDVAAEDLSTELDLTTITTPGPDAKDLIQGLEPPPNAAAPEGVGQGDKGDVQGFEAIAAKGFNALPLEGTPGFAGDSGAGPKGDGTGLLGGKGGGALDAGGFGYRSGNTIEIAKAQGGNDASEAAVAKGLLWLAAHQSPDGKWSLDRYHTHNPQCRCKDLNFEGNVGANDTAGTAFGLLPFLGAGQHHRRGSFQKNIFKGLNYLISKQDTKGDLRGGMYAHGLGTICLCEAYALSQDAKLRVAAQNAINFIVYAQHDQTYGWHYAPKGVGDTSVVGWQVMALRSGQMAGLTVPSRTLEGARKWLDSVQKEGGAKYSYNKDTGPSHTMTSVGLLCRQYLGNYGPRNEFLIKGCEYMLTNVPQAKATPNETLGPIYYYYYATQVMHHMEGNFFAKWNPLMRDKLIRLQEKEGHRAGSWSPVGTDHGGAGGRMYSTSLAILTLEVYYRHMPLYRRGSAAGMDVAAGPDKPDDKKAMDKKDEKKPEEKK
jgi:hypothetical protein